MISAERALQRDGRIVLVSLFELIKPAVTRLVLVTMLCGALAAPGPIDWQRLAWALLGTALVVGSANALNMVLERDVDALMTRTRARPIPSGRLSTELATAFGLGLAATGLPLLLALVSPLVAALNLLALVIYVLAYTPLKRLTPLALHVGAIPGAIPPLIGWAAMTGELSFDALVLFAILFVWQLPHFLAISVFRRSEYERAGIRVKSVVSGIARTKRSIVGYAALFVGTTLLPVATGAGWAYLLAAITTGVGFTALAAYGFLSAKTPDGEARWARTLFFASLPHLTIIYAALVFSRVLA